MAEHSSKYPAFSGCESPKHWPLLSLLLCRCEHLHAVCVADHWPISLVQKMNCSRQAQGERINFCRSQLKVEFAMAVLAPLRLKRNADPFGEALGVLIRDGRGMQ